MATIENVIKVMRPLCYMASLDIANAYFFNPDRAGFQMFSQVRLGGLVISIQSLAERPVIGSAYVHQDCKVNLCSYVKKTENDKKVIIMQR